MLVDQKIR